MDKNSLEKSIQEGLNNLYGIFSQLSLLKEYTQYAVVPEYDDLRSSFESVAKVTYLQIVAYIEMQNLKSYLAEFIQAFKEKLDARQIFDEYYIEETGEVVSQLYNDFWQYLKPFNFEKPDTLESIGLIYLERVLENTDRFIKIQGVTIINESSIYKAIRPYIEMLFPKVINTDGHYIFNMLKNYKPDILIPDLHTAVEYKFINSTMDIKSTICEIADDVIGYKEKIGTNDYKQFYTVYYIKDSLLTKERFFELWEERCYPKTWKAIPVFERT